MSAPRAIAERLADGEWHRLHPASPLLKGGLTLIAIIGILLANLRERLIEFFIPHAYEADDPVDVIIDGGYIGWGLLAVVVILAVLVGAFSLSWRMHTFRVTEEVVEVRSGIVFRTHRQARLDRIQGINIQRQFFARLFGAAKLEISQAGNDANVQLAYLASGAADELRREILLRASHSRRGTAAAAGGEATPLDAVAPGQEADGADTSGPAELAAAQPAPSGVVDRRLHEFMAPELDPDAAPPESVVTIHPGRLVGSLLLSGWTIFILLLTVGTVLGIFVWGQWEILFFVLPGAIGFVSYYTRRITRSLRYSIAGTPDGIRIGYGLLTLSNETLPPGRIHSVELSQPLLWRPAGWWEIRVNLASQSSTGGSAGLSNTTIMPVGDLDDAMRVMDLLLPGLAIGDSEGLVEAGLRAKAGEDDGFVTSPKRAAWLRWFSWRRNGFALTDDAFVLRRGAIWRQLVVVPAGRVQSLSLEQGPVGRMSRLATVHLHTVAGPISARLGALDVEDARGFFDRGGHHVIDTIADEPPSGWGSERVQA